MPKKVQKQIKNDHFIQKDKKISKETKKDEKEHLVQCDNQLKINHDMHSSSLKQNFMVKMLNSGHDLSNQKGSQNQKKQNFKEISPSKNQQKKIDINEKINNIKQNNLDEQQFSSDESYQVGSKQLNNNSQSLEQEQSSQQIGQQQQIRQQYCSQSHQSPIVPALKNMEFRKVRGSRIQDLLQGKIKIDDGLISSQVNQYLGVKNKHKHGHKNGKKAQHQKDNEVEPYNYNEQDSSDMEDYVQSSSGRDQFDSDFDLTESYPGKRGRKKGTKLKKRGRGRGRPKVNSQSDSQNDSLNQNDEKVHKRRGRPRKTPINEEQFSMKNKYDHHDGQKKRRGRPRKFPLSEYSPKNTYHNNLIAIAKKIQQQIKHQYENLDLSQNQKQQNIYNKISYIFQQQYNMPIPIHTTLTIQPTDNIINYFLNNNHLEYYYQIQKDYGKEKENINKLKNDRHNYQKIEEEEDDQQFGI